MALVRGALTDDDLRMLVKGPTADERALAAHKLCRKLDREDLTDEQRHHAHEILRVMARDAADLVRRALAVTLKSSNIVPRDVAMALAQDVESIALPILNFSPAFTDDDLVEIVRHGGPVRQTAVAKRPKLSARVTTSLVDHGTEAAVRVACANDNAAFTEASLQTVIHRFSRSDQMLEALAYRQALPLSVTEKLIALVSEGVRDHLVNHHALTPEAALALTAGAGERATVDLFDTLSDASDLKAFVQHLRKSDRLSASLLLRGLAQGHMAFFEWSLAELAGVPHHRTWLMIHDGGPLGLRAIYERAGLPSRLFATFRAGVDTYHAMSFDESKDDKAKFQERMIQRFLTQGASAPSEDVDYLLERMDLLSDNEDRAVSAAS